MTGTTGHIGREDLDSARPSLSHGAMQAPRSRPLSASMDLRATVPTPDGRLEVVASEMDGRWWVVARCGRWRGFGTAPQPGSAVEAALGPYADGVSLAGGQRR